MTIIFITQLLSCFVTHSKFFFSLRCHALPAINNDPSLIRGAQLCPEKYIPMLRAKVLDEVTSSFSLLVETLEFSACLFNGISATAVSYVCRLANAQPQSLKVFYSVLQCCYIYCSVSKTTGSCDRDGIVKKPWRNRFP
jgi:hypothetical protein